MNIRQIKNKISTNLINARGWKTNRKIIVFESDDWGSIRMPSNKAYHNMLKKNIRVDRCPFNSYDSLASEKDLNELFNLLVNFKDYKRNHPVITANTVVCNPDFIKIRESGYRKYYYENFTTTLEKYPFHQNSISFWKEGIKQKIFHPQFHGREHLNISLWLKLLQNNNDIFRLAFNNNFWGISPLIYKPNKINIQAAFDAEKKVELQLHKKIIKDGLELFSKQLGFKSKTFIANNFIWDNSLNDTLKRENINIIQGIKYQKLPLFSRSKHRLIRHYTGELKNNQIYLVRNCFFEPTLFPNKDIISSCLQEIDIAFAWKKPAIISLHRLNFIGYLDENNRNKNLELFRILLNKILKNWPEIEFMTSKELGNLILDSYNSH